MHRITVMLLSMALLLASAPAYARQKHQQLPRCILQGDPILTATSEEAFKQLAISLADGNDAAFHRLWNAGQIGTLKHGQAAYVESTTSCGYAKIYVDDHEGPLWALQYNLRCK